MDYRKHCNEKKGYKASPNKECLARNARFGDMAISYQRTEAPNSNDSNTRETAKSNRFVNKWRGVKVSCRMDLATNIAVDGKR